MSSNHRASSPTASYSSIVRKGTCKTSLAYKLFGEIASKFDYAFAMCGTRDGVGKFRKCLPFNAVWHGYQEERFT